MSGASLMSLSIARSDNDESSWEASCGRVADTSSCVHAWARASG